MTAGGLVPPQPGADRDVRDVRAGGRLRRLPGRRRGLGAARGRRGVDPRGRALHGRAAPVRLRGARRGVRVPVLRRSSPWPAPTSCRSRSCPGRRSCARCRSGCWRARSSSSTTCATSRPTGAPASARSRCGSAASARAALYAAMLAVAFATAPLPWVLGSMTAWLLLPLAGDAAGRCGVVRVVRTRTDGPSLNGALARTGVLQLAVLPAVLRRDPRERRHRPVRLERAAPDAAASPARCRPPTARSTERELLRRRADRRGRGRRPRRGGAAAGLRRRRIERVQAALAALRPGAGRGAEGMNGAQLLDACRRADDLPQALAAIDLALWDRAGRRARKRRSRRCSPTTRRRAVPVNATLDGARPRRRRRAGGGRGGRGSRA